MFYWNQDSKCVNLCAVLKQITALQSSKSLKNEKSLQSNTLYE